MILDPFAGTSKLKQIKTWAKIVTTEIEPEWAYSGYKSDAIADALYLPFADRSFDAIITSPTYSNRLADHHNAADASYRISYTFALGRQLHPHNSGKIQWSYAYRKFHEDAWKEILRVLKPGGYFLLNISDHIRKGNIIPVTQWHIDTLVSLGLTFRSSQEIKTQRLRRGANFKKRVDFESLIEFTKGDRNDKR